jgi:putative transposase
MARINIKIGTRYIHHDQMYIVEAVLANNYFSVKNLSFGSVEKISYEDIVLAWAEGNIRFEIIGRNTKDDPSYPLRTEYEFTDFELLDPLTAKETWRRYKLVSDIWNFYNIKDVRMVSRSLIKDYVEMIKTKTKTSEDMESISSKGTSVGSIERYMKYLVNSGGDIRSLVPERRKQGGKGKNRLDPVVDQIINTCIQKYESIKERDSSFSDFMTDVINLIADENQYRALHEKLDIPDEVTLRRRIKAVGWNVVLGRSLSRREQKAHGAVSPGVIATRPLERVEIDHTPLPFFVVDEEDGLPIGKPMITATIDHYTRMIVGWHIGFEQEGYGRIMLCLKHSFLPKPDYRSMYEVKHDYPAWGLFEMLVIDQGKDFKSTNLLKALGELGIIREENPTFTPWYKPRIERFFRTINQKLLKGKPGYTGINPFAMGDYDPIKDAIIGYEDFKKIFHKFIIDLYPHQFHKGIEDTPINRWMNSIKIWPPALSHSVDDIKYRLLPIVHRTIQRTGVAWEHNVYRNEDLPRLLEAYKGQVIPIKYNPEDMNSLYIPDKESLDGYAIFTSTRPDYTKGLSIAKHKIIRETIIERKKKVNIVSLAETKREINEIVENSFYKTKSIRRRSKYKKLLPALQENSSTLSASSEGRSSELSLFDITETEFDFDEIWDTDYDLK